MFHSSLNIPFLNSPMLWRTLLTNSPASHVVVGEGEFGKDKQAFNGTLLFSVRASEIRSFTKVENGALVSLGSKGTGVSQVMKRSCQAQAH